MKAQISKQVAKDSVTVRAKQAAEERDAAARRQIERAAMGIPRPRSPSPARWSAIAKTIRGRILVRRGRRLKPSRGPIWLRSKPMWMLGLAELVTDRTASIIDGEAGFLLHLSERAAAAKSGWRSVGCLHIADHLVHLVVRVGDWSGWVGRRYRPSSRSRSPRRDYHRSRSPSRHQYATSRCIACLLQPHHSQILPSVTSGLQDSFKQPSSLHTSRLQAAAIGLVAICCQYLLLHNLQCGLSSFEFVCTEEGFEICASRSVCTYMSTCPRYSACSVCRAGAEIMTGAGDAFIPPFQGCRSLCMSAVFTAC